MAWVEMAKKKVTMGEVKKAIDDKQYQEAYISDDVWQQLKKTILRNDREGVARTFIRFANNAKRELYHKLCSISTL